MKQRFFTNTIQSNFIKALVYNTPIPLTKTVNDNSYIVEGNTYIYKNNIIKCTKSGIVKMPELDENYRLLYKNGDIETSFNYLSYNSNIRATNDISYYGVKQYISDTSYYDYYINIGTIYANNSYEEYNGGTIADLTLAASFYGYSDGTISPFNETEEIDGGKLVPFNSYPVVSNYTPLDGDVIKIFFNWYVDTSLNYYLRIGSNNYKVKDNLALILPYQSYYFKYIAEENEWKNIGTTSPEIFAENTYESLNYKFINQAQYKTVDTFLFGKYYPKSTELYCSKHNYYDSETHEHLGDLLRCYRDIYDLNLMPFYNCFSGNYISNFIIKDSEIENNDSSNFKTLKIPVKYNTTYTIAIDCSSSVRLAPVLLSNNNLIESITLYTGNNTTDTVDIGSSLYTSNIKILDSASFRNPITWGVDIVNTQHEKLLSKYERYLYLLIQIPFNNSSSVVVLEGDYTKAGTDDIYSTEKIFELNDLELSDLMISDLSLLQMNNNISYPYANRLIEYLLLNVITSRDPITRNVKRIQDLYPPSYEFTPEVWDNLLRSKVYYDYQKSDLLRQLDLNGFVDKDTETLMIKQG